MRRFLALVALLPFYLGGAEEFYIFSYKIAIKNHSAINESYRFSRAMVIPRRYAVVGRCQIDLEESDPAQAQKKLKASPAKVLECFFRHGVGLRDDTTFNNHQSRSLTTLWIEPRHLIVEFGEGGATLTLIEPQP